MEKIITYKDFQISIRLEKSCGYNGWVTAGILQSDRSVQMILGRQVHGNTYEGIILDILNNIYYKILDRGLYEKYKDLVVEIEKAIKKYTDILKERS